MIENSKNILLHDTKNVFKNFIKNTFIEDFKIEDYDRFKDKKLIDFNNYDAVFIILNEEIEMIDLIWAYIKVDNLFVCSKSETIIKRMNDFEHITVIDLNKSDNEILSKIGYHLNIYEGNLKESKVMSL